METIHVTTLDPNTRVRFVYDDDYTHDKPWCDADTPETIAELEPIWRQECERIERGALLAVGIILQRRCVHCGTWKDVDDVDGALWGILFDSSERGEALDQYAREFFHGMV